MTFFGFKSLNSTADTIFITANGVIGHRVAVRLLKAGYKVRVGVPDPNTANDLKTLGAEVIPFKWEEETNYKEALLSVKTVFFVIDPLLHEGWADHFPKFFEACKASPTVNHIVKVSFYHALTATRARVIKGFSVAFWEDNPFQHIPFIQEHGSCDESIIKCQSLDYTLLFVTHKMSDPITTQKKNLKNGALYGASAGKEVAYVSPNDIAAAAVKILTDPKSHRRVGYTLTGATALKDSDVAKILGHSLAKQVNYVDMSPEDFEAREKKMDPSWIVEDLVPIEKMKRTGIEAGFMSKDFEKICGRKPETYETYLSMKDDMTTAEREAF
jgi:uncharacterized protein YbjT (DUF2867 family)